MLPPPEEVSTVVFDIDGTLLDSATGILAGFRRSLQSVGVPVPTETELRLHLGPPLREFLITAGVGADRLEEATYAYHDYYLSEGLRQAVAYPGIGRVLGSLAAAGITLATASAKRTGTAEAIVAAHGLSRFFTVIGGTDRPAQTKAETITSVLARLGADPAQTIMVGDRRHDVVGAHACDVGMIGALWGYGGREELSAAGADWLAAAPADLSRLLIAPGR